MKALSHVLQLNKFQVIYSFYVEGLQQRKSYRCIEANNNKETVPLPGKIHVEGDMTCHLLFFVQSSKRRSDMLSFGKIKALEAQASKMRL